MSFTYPGLGKPHQNGLDSVTLLPTTGQVSRLSWKPTLESSVENPYSFDPDPIWIQGFDDKKLKNVQRKKKLFWNKNYYKLHKKPSALKREHSALQTWNFLIFLLLLWVIFAPLDPLTRLNPDPDRSHAGIHP